ncbi:MAG: hypothetical protein ABIH11_00145 [Candidatus Altiarchaeota archaeon]
MVLATASASAETEAVRLYFFYGNDCHICGEFKPVIEAAQEKHPELDAVMLEVQYNKTNNQLLDDMAEAYGRKIDFVPAAFIGDQVIEGYVAGHTEKRLEDIIADCIENGCVDPMDMTTESETTVTTTLEATPDNTGEVITTTTEAAGKNESILCPIDSPCGNQTVMTTTTTTTITGFAGNDEPEGTSILIILAVMVTVAAAVVFILKAHNLRQ